MSGKISLGNFGFRPSNDSISAWFDEFKVKETRKGLTLNKEEICNHARGTFIYAPTKPILQDYADEFNHQNNDLNRLAGTTGKQFVCLVNYVDFKGVKFSSLEEFKAIEGHTSLIQAEALGTSARTLLTHPESLNIDPNKPRPDTSENDFCLSCHEKDNMASLSVDALKESLDTIFKKGPRQPTQPPATISGLIPSSLSNPPRWANQGNVTMNYEYIDDLIADPSPPESKVVFVKYKNFMIPIVAAPD